MTQGVKSRFGTAILIASLALNAVLGGYVAVQAWRRFEISAATTTPRGLLRLVRWRLPSADRAILDEAIGKREKDIAVAQAEYQKALSVAIASLTRPDFSESDFRTAVAVARTKRLQLADLGLDVFIDAAAHISPQGRQGLAPKNRR